MLAFVFFLNLLDMLITIFAINRYPGLLEANPVMALMLDHSVYFFVVVKVIGVGFLCALLEPFKRDPLPKLLIRLVAMFYSAVTIFNLSCIYYIEHVG